MAPSYPEPLVIQPRDSHQCTIILLHGRGSNAAKFGPILLSSSIAHLDQACIGAEHTLVSAFPHAKFVFPTASKRRATAYNRSIINQWFDNWPLSTDTPPATTQQEKQRREYLPADGLRETSLYLHKLLREEISLLGGDAKRVILGGLSQGCAASLVALLLWDGDPLGAAFGMCGWLPFRHQMEHFIQEVHASESDKDSPFIEKTEDDDNIPPPVQAIMSLTEDLEMSLPGRRPRELPFQHVPLFLAHGTEDEKVPVVYGRDARRCLSEMGVDVTWEEYAGLGHWYSGDMLGDLVAFLKKYEPDLE
ncbi:acyl-protein thioesterase [Trichophyton mentagrophytes]|nr:acyl-protein thioesterase [Trichophyton mentagrophytes]